MPASFFFSLVNWKPNCGHQLLSDVVDISSPYLLDLRLRSWAKRATVKCEFLYWSVSWQGPTCQNLPSIDDALQAFVIFWWHPFDNEDAVLELYDRPTRHLIREGIISIGRLSTNISSSISDLSPWMSNADHFVCCYPLSTSFGRGKLSYLVYINWICMRIASAGG